MALKKIRLVWATPPLAEGRWRLGLYCVQQTIDPTRPRPPGHMPAYWKGYLHHTLNLSVRSLFAYGALAFVCAYFAAAAVLHARYENANPHNRVAYLDLVLPTRWSERERLQGEGFLLYGREQLQAGRFSEGFGLLRLAVDKNPRDFDARLDLARLYVAIRLRPQGEKILRDGLALGYPGRDYLETTFSLAADADQPAAWVELCELARERLDALAPDTRPAGDSRWLDQQAVKALFAAERPAEAAALVAGRYPDTDPFRREIAVLALLAADQAPAAVALATVWAEEQPRAPEPLRLLVRAHREAGTPSGMDEALLRLRALDPAKPDALLYALVQNQLAGRPAAARAAQDELLFRHGANEGLYPALAAVLVEVRLTDQLPALAREMIERGLPSRPVRMAELQAALVVRDWPRLLANAEIVRAHPGAPFNAVQTTWLETMVRLARACGDATSGNQAALVEIVADHPGTLRLYRLVLDHLLASGRIDTAAQVLALAEGPYPAARSLAATRVIIEERRAALAAAAPAPVAPPAAERDALAGPEALAAAFAARIQAGDTDGALALLSTARRAQPAWLSGAEYQLEILELPVRARGEDPLRLQLLVRNALARGGPAPASLLALARALHPEGHRAHALLLVKEILRRDPADAEALAQLAIWEPRDNKRPVDALP